MEKTSEETYTPVKTKGGRFAHVLLSPRISEKAAVSASGGKYVFNVSIDSTKIEISKAVEALYKVNVDSVRIVRNIGKVVRRGRISGRRNRIKKAYVTLKRGQKIELYEGV
ncbi:MAG: 50S ribosomal protein L23 [Patescibacteria group bacterium]